MQPLVVQAAKLEQQAQRERTKTTPIYVPTPKRGATVPEGPILIDQQPVESETASGGWEGKTDFTPKNQEPRYEHKGNQNYYK